MARLHIEKIKGWQVCIVSDVLLPDGSRKDYAGCGPNGLADIISRIRAEAHKQKAESKCLRV